MMRLLAIVFSATFFAVALAHEASALRGGGIRAVGVRGVSAGAYRGALRTRNVGYRAAAWGGRRYWRGNRWYGYGVGLGAVAGGYYGYSSYGYSGMGTSDSSGATAAKVAATGPGMCGVYLYWKDGKCNDARAK
jgi:hypothetical protein